MLPTECERQYQRLVGSADRLRERARRQGRALAPGLAALGGLEFARLPPEESELLRSYYGLDGSRLSTKKELAGRLGLTLWKVDAALNRAVAMLLTPENYGALSPDARREQGRAKIAQRRREHGRPFARALHDLGPDALDKLGARERDLVRRYYELGGGERPWTRRELAREYGRSTGRVEDLVNAAVGDLTGMDVRPRFDRVRAVCGGSFTARSRTSQRHTCGTRCASELKRAAGRASARARNKRTSVEGP